MSDEWLPRWLGLWQCIAICEVVRADASLTGSVLAGLLWRVGELEIKQAGRFPW